MFRDKTLTYSKIFTVIKLVKQLNNKIQKLAKILISKLLS